MTLDESFSGSHRNRHETVKGKYLTSCIVGELKKERVKCVLVTPDVHFPTQENLLFFLTKC